jgi:hypothetical protein
MRKELGRLAAFEAVGVALYVVLAILAFWSPHVALAGTCVMWVYWGVVVTMGEKKPGKPRPL